MRSFCILAAVCIVGVYSNPTDMTNECGKKCNVDMSNENLDKLDHDKKFNKSNEAYCLIDCAFSQKKLAEENRQTYYENFMEDIKTADEFTNNFKNASYTREELESKLTECKNKGLQGADFLKCIKFLEPPFWNYYMQLA